MKKKHVNDPFEIQVGRRHFVSALTRSAGIAALGMPLVAGASPAPPDWTVGQVMDVFTREINGSPLRETVDTLKSGSRDTIVKGIVTTMFATLDVIRRTIDLGANFIIAHEPTFYNHLDDTTWLKDVETYRFKADLLKRNNIAVWRNHDYIHLLVPDGVMAGVVAQLRWGTYYDPGNPGVFKLPATSLRNLITHVKSTLGVPQVRYHGDLAQSCSKVLLMPGAYGGRNQILAAAREKPDVILCGEIQEWETAEYIRDARSMGQQISLVVIGHVASEEPGSAFLASWLKERVAGVNITHVPAANVLDFF